MPLDSKAVKPINLKAATSKFNNTILTACVVITSTLWQISNVDCQVNNTSRTEINSTGSDELRHLGADSQINRPPRITRTEDDELGWTIAIDILIGIASGLIMVCLYQLATFPYRWTYNRYCRRNRKKMDYAIPLKYMPVSANIEQSTANEAERESSHRACSNVAAGIESNNGEGSRRAAMSDNPNYIPININYGFSTVEGDCKDSYHATGRESPIYICLNSVTGTESDGNGKKPHRIKATENPCYGLLNIIDTELRIGRDSNLTTVVVNPSYMCFGGATDTELNRSKDSRRVTARDSNLALAIENPCYGFDTVDTKSSRSKVPNLSTAVVNPSYMCITSVSMESNRGEDLRRATAIENPNYMYLGVDTDGLLDVIDTELTEIENPNYMYLGVDTDGLLDVIDTELTDFLNVIDAELSSSRNPRRATAVANPNYMCLSSVYIEPEREENSRHANR